MHGDRMSFTLWCPFKLLLMHSLLQQCWSAVACENEACDMVDSTHLLQVTLNRASNSRVQHLANGAGQDESMCQLFSKRGLLFSCDVHPIVPQSDTSTLSLNQQSDKTGARSAIHSATASLDQLGMSHYIQDIEKHGDGAVVYVVTTALQPFVDQILPQLKSKIKLVTGDAVKGPIAVLGKASFDELANDSRVMQWWGQNGVDGEESNPKFTQLPIGLDYHTLKDQATNWGPQATPETQESELLAMSKAAPIFMNRSTKVFYSGGSSSPLRAHIADLLQAQPDLVDEPTSYLGRNAFWEECGLHRFVASPPGAGVDCHRTWEAIALGSIPLVSNRLHGLYEKNRFNVVMLSDEDWGDLSSAAVKKKMEVATAKHQASIPEAMFLKYWIDKIRANYK
eukprot:TRINITY_DN30544_c0_g1_i1.p1 TRINITY_DN30544_c0_g1~~TRINITY_DN30544_c0_g1_i1.p1  ORF type:complete len:396 (+),score=63.35 TRINITY_DN30544_c0_g1_i1:61-1248(+)